MRKFRLLLYIILVPAGAFILFLAYATIDDYQPEEVIDLHTDNQADVLPDTATFDLFSWNIGYAGLDASMDFFYDGGAQMRPTEEGVANNLTGIANTLLSYNNLDFILLQEVDRDSKRSYHMNEYAVIEQMFPGYYSSFGKNYDVAFVPIPLKEPMGKVLSGLMTLSKYAPSAVSRYGFPGNYSWPVRLFMLDRCFLVNRFPISNGKELLVINTHNSAYDDGSLRKHQMEYLQDMLLNEYKTGNYVIVGGDWNQTPNGFVPELPGYLFDTINLTFVEKDFPAADWAWAFDTQLPTNRRVDTPYNRATSLTTVIDCFLLSPNIRVDTVKTIHLGFQYSDHQPVLLKVALIP